MDVEGQQNDNSPWDIGESVTSTGTSPEMPPELCHQRAGIDGCPSGLFVALCREMCCMPSWHLPPRGSDQLLEWLVSNTRLALDRTCFTHIKIYVGEYAHF